MGVALDTTVCEASVTPERAVRYVRAIEALLGEQRECGDVGRRGERAPESCCLRPPPASA